MPIPSTMLLDWEQAIVDALARGRLDPIYGLWLLTNAPRKLPKWQAAFVTEHAALFESDSTYASPDFAVVDHLAMLCRAAVAQRKTHQQEPT